MLQEPESTPEDPFRAPKGMMRLVHIDPRDSHPTVEDDFPDWKTLRARTSTMMSPQLETMRVFDDTGQSVMFLD